jgi:hypothetical protein
VETKLSFVSLCGGFYHSPGAPGFSALTFRVPQFAMLHRERSTNNPIGNRHLEMNVALDAWNRLVTDLWGECWSGINVDLLFGFTV